MPTHHTRSPFTPWSGFLVGVLGGVAVSAAFVGFGIGYSMGMMQNPGALAVPHAAAPSIPSPPAAPAAPTPAAAQARPVNIAADHIRGSLAAEVSIIEYSDFECPFCKRHHPTLQSILEKYQGKVNLVYRHYPLAFHPNAQTMAEATECAAELGGNDGFWKLHDAIFEQAPPPGGFTAATLPQVAANLGMSEPLFTACLTSGKYTQRVKDQMAEGVSAGVRGTPGNIIVNNVTKEQRVVSGAVPAASLESAIDSLLAN